MGRLDGRQAATNCDRPGEFVLGGFEEDGREEVKKEFRSGKAAAKPDFFMGGCGPTVPTGPKRKLRTSWLNNDKKEDEKPRVEHVPKPLKKWTPVAKRQVPLRSKTHDGTMSHEARKGKKPEAEKPEENKEEKKEEVEEAKPEVEEPKKEPAPVKAKEEPKPKPAVVPPPAAAPKPAWEPSPVIVRKALQDSSHMDVTKATDKQEDKPVVTTAKDGKCAVCASKDDEIAALKAEIEKLKAEKGELAATVKKSKGSLAVNKELKQEVNTLKEQLEAAEKLTAKADPAHHQARLKLENKLNTLKMIMDGKVDKNNLDELKEHVDMLNMILNQDLKKEGMKNIWA